MANRISQNELLYSQETCHFLKILTAVSVQVIFSLAYISRTHTVEGENLKHMKPSMWRFLLSSFLTVPDALEANASLFNMLTVAVTKLT